MTSFTGGTTHRGRRPGWSAASLHRCDDRGTRPAVAAVIGVSGTGSIGAEVAARLGFGSVTLVDPDKIEKKNLNRILNSTSTDAARGRLKVDMFSQAIEEHRGDGVAVSIADTLGTREAIEAVGQCDVIFCCVDSKEGRQYADLIASAFVIPLFDGASRSRRSSTTALSPSQMLAAGSTTSSLAAPRSPTAEYTHGKACGPNTCIEPTQTPSVPNSRQAISRYP